MSQNDVSSYLCQLKDNFGGRTRVLNKREVKYEIYDLLAGLVVGSDPINVVNAESGEQYICISKSVA